MSRLLSASLGAVVGATAALLMDPARGRARRAQLIDRSAAIARRAERAGNRQLRFVGSWVAGKLEALQARNVPTERANEATLQGRVESELFRDYDVPKGAINVNAEQGIVVLRGEVADEATRETLAARAGEIEGVSYVENLLHLPGESAPTVR